MKRGRLTRTLTAAATISLAVFVAGCTVDLDLVTTPDTVPLGGDVNFEVTVKNRSSCPVGDVQVVVFPFIPVQQFATGEPEVDAALNLLCAGAEADLSGINGNCSIQGDEIVCILDPAETLGNGQGTIVLGTDQDSQIRCTREGSTIRCALPTSVAEVIEQPSAAAPLSCVPSDFFALCSTTLLNIAEMQSDSFVLPANVPGSFHNLAFVVSARDDGLCKLDGAPCDETSDCSGVGNTCGNGRCSTNGFGCSTEIPGDCPAGTCVDCGPPDDGLALAGGACTATRVGVQAPAMSPWSIALTASALLGLGVLVVRRRLRSR